MLASLVNTMPFSGRASVRSALFGTLEQPRHGQRRAASLPRVSDLFKMSAPTGTLGRVGPQSPPTDMGMTLFVQPFGFLPTRSSMETPSASAIFTTALIEGLGVYPDSILRKVL